MLAVAAMLLVSCTPGPSSEPGNHGGKTSSNSGEKIDDWAFSATDTETDMRVGSTKMSNYNAPQALSPGLGAMDMMAESESLGFAVGGAKDINNFRENIENGYVPLPTDITYEGLFYDYYFDTGKKETCEKLFCPSYAMAVSEDPFSEDDDYFLSVGLNSGLKESDFERKKLNLVIVLDISGSMGSPFDQYYYDSFGNYQELNDAEKEDAEKTKMEIASRSVVDLMDHLNDDDRFGMVVFDDIAYLAKPLSDVGETDMDQIADHILELHEMGGTNMEAGFEMGTELFDDLDAEDMNMAEYENRIIFLTDAMPNLGDTSRKGMLGMAADNADDDIYSTFIGIGVDFNTELIEYMTKIRGANYYSVHSSSEFNKRMDEEFEYMVTPLVFNLELSLEADGFDIKEVYGSPEADEATGEIMKVNTLFPSKTEEGETKGGLVLLHLKKKSDDATLKLTASYEDREGNEDSDTKTIEFDGNEQFYDNSGIRKGILLSRYTNLMVDWIMDERDGADDWQYEKPYLFYEGEDIARCTYETGCIVPDWDHIQLGEWERQSMQLQVSREYEKIFADFATYFEEEMDAIGDETLQQELDILELLKEK